LTWCKDLDPDVGEFGREYDGTDYTENGDESTKDDSTSMCELRGVIRQVLGPYPRSLKAAFKNGCSSDEYPPTQLDFGREDGCLPSCTYNRKANIQANADSETSKLTKLATLFFPQLELNSPLLLAVAG
jgi:hypothetical protein